mmetsp:Transcript_8416/g.12980  ORF Transcript_8416/g.12980 Transcript_8416/m.12980 type:complete len:130 (-) Transcript_8416:1204-1593(-)
MPVSDPKFPIVNPNPTVDNCMKSMRFGDWMSLGGITAGSWIYGYMVGKPFRTASASCAATIGFTFASIFVLQNTRGRFLGFRENSREVKIYGLDANQPPKYEAPDRRNPTYRGFVSDNMKREIDWKDYN